MLLDVDALRQSRAVDESHAGFREMLRDEIAFNAWYAEALPRVYRYLYSRCGGDAALAEELTQEAFVEAVRHADRWDGRADLVTWVTAIGRNKLVDHFRRLERDVRRRRALRARACAANRWQDADIDADIQTALSKLPADQRVALVLRAADGFSVREVAAVIGRSEDATESLIRRARAFFRRAYGDTTDA